MQGKAEIGLKVGEVLHRHKMAKHFELTIGDAGFSFRRKTEAIAVEAALDGLYVVRTNLPAEVMGDSEMVTAYKSLSRVERAFRSIKTVDLEIRPIFYWASPRVKAHIFLCMLAYHVEHHMRAKLAPLLYDDTDRETAARMRNSAVANLSAKVFMRHDLRQPGGLHRLGEAGTVGEDGGQGIGDSILDSLGGSRQPAGGLLGGGGDRRVGDIVAVAPPLLDHVAGGGRRSPCSSACPPASAAPAPIARGHRGGGHADRIVRPTLGQIKRPVYECMSSASRRPRPSIACCRHGPRSPAASARIQPVLRRSSPGKPSRNPFADDAPAIAHDLRIHGFP